jgi:CheY-like chemotaxis protein
MQSIKADADGLLKGVRVLVVDDEEDARTLVAMALGQYGAQVSMAGSAAEAFALLSGPGELPGVIISDIGMPEIDGYTFIRRLRSLSPAQGGRIPAIALTAFGFVEDRVRALAAGFQMHMVKPFDPTELSVTVASFANRLKLDQTN